MSFCCAHQKLLSCIFHFVLPSRLFSDHSRGTSRRKPELNVTRDLFLAALGDLTNVPISKVGDRISLAFTQTSPIVNLSDDQIIAIPGESSRLFAFMSCAQSFCEMTLYHTKDNE